MALAARRVANLIGRRLTVLATATVFVVGVLVAAFTPTYPVLQRVREAGDIEAEISEVRGVNRKQAGTRELLSASLRPLLLVGVLLAVEIEQQFA